MEIGMDHRDFERLVIARADWGQGWADAVVTGRFELAPPAGFAGATPALHWKAAYWLGPGYAGVILARAYLADAGHPCEAAWDIACKEWVILTDYGAAVPSAPHRA